MSQLYDVLNYPNLASVPATVVSGIADLNGISNLALWLAARKITGISGGGAIATWSDSSGNGRNYTGVGSPTYQTAQINGQPAVQLNGTSQYFKPATVYNPSGKMTIMMVLKYTGGNPFSSAKTPSPGGGMTYANDGGQHLFQASNAISGWANTSLIQGYIDTANYILIAMRAGVGMLQICCNGIPWGSTTPDFATIIAAGDTTYGLLLGVLNNNGSLSGYMTGYIAEFALWPYALNELQWALAQNFLTNLYAIPT
jgi:hypothetical protein